MEEEVMVYKPTFENFFIPNPKKHGEVVKTKSGKIYIVQKNGSWVRQRKDVK